MNDREGCIKQALDELMAHRLLLLFRLHKSARLSERRADLVPSVELGSARKPQCVRSRSTPRTSASAAPARKGALKSLRRSPSGPQRTLPPFSLLDKFRPIISWPVPTIDFPDDELAAVTAALRRAIEGDRYPRAPRLDALRAALGRLDAAAEPTPKAAPEGSPKEPSPAKADKRARREI